MGYPRRGQISMCQGLARPGPEMPLAGPEMPLGNAFGRAGDASLDWKAARQASRLPGQLSGFCACSRLSEQPNLGPQNTKSGLNGVPMPRFRLILKLTAAMDSGMPLVASSCKKRQKTSQMLPPLPPVGPPSPRSCCCRIALCAVYACFLPACTGSHCMCGNLS